MNARLSSWSYLKFLSYMTRNCGSSRKTVANEMWNLTHSSHSTTLLCLDHPDHGLHEEGCLALGMDSIAVRVRPRRGSHECWIRHRGMSRRHGRDTHRNITRWDEPMRLRGKQHIVHACRIAAEAGHWIHLRGQCDTCTRCEGYPFQIYTCVSS